MSYRVPEDDRRCTYTGEDGERCKAYRVKGLELCAGHARSKGELDTWEKGAEAKAQAAEAASLHAGNDLARSDHRVSLVRVPIPVGDIMRQLSKDAKGGDTAAARELRAWLSQFPPDDAAADASDLAAPQRSRIAAILARALAEDEESLQMEGFEGGTQDGFDSPLPARSASQLDGHPRDDGSHRDERGSRHLTAIHTPLAEDGSHTQHRGPHPGDGSHTPDGTGDGSQMTVDDCIEVAERGSDLEEAKTDGRS